MDKFDFVGPELGRLGCKQAHVRFCAFTTMPDRAELSDSVGTSVKGVAFRHLSRIMTRRRCTCSSRRTMICPFEKLAAELICTHSGVLGEVK